MSDTYRIVKTFGNSASELVDLVNQSMEQGWQPVGAAFFNSDSRCWCQGMTRVPDNLKPGQAKLKEPKR